MRKILPVLVLALMAFIPNRVFDSTAQTLPFSQNWTTTGLITAPDNWTGVPGIQGFLGDDASAGTGVDPQTVIADYTTQDVIANQAAPNTNTSGGVAEFDGIANPVVALQGSGTADFPNIIMNLNTTGNTSITVAYNLRDIDGSTDNAVQAVALQYRIGSSGNFTNVPAGFVADATSGPSLATLVTPVSVVLPAGCDNQALVQVRVITSNAVGSDEWVGIDDINVTGTTGGCSGAPSGQAGFGAITPTDVSASITLTAGIGGTGRVLKINTVNSFTNMVDGADPSATTVYGGGEQVVYNASGTGPVNVTGLTASTTYYLGVYEFNCSSGRFYLNPAATTSFSTSAPPAIGLQLSAANTSYLIDFDNTLANVNNGQFAGTGFTTSPAAGQLNSNAWEVLGWSDGSLLFGGSNTTGDFARGFSAVVVGTGGTYAFEITAGNRGLGFQPGGSDWAPGSVALKMQNQTGATISTLLVSYKLYARNDQGRASSFNFAHSSDNTTYTSVGTFDYTSPDALEGINWKPQYRVMKITGLSITSGSYYYIRWNSADVSGTGSRDEFALDDIAIVANPTSYTPGLVGSFESAVVNSDLDLTGATTISGTLNIVSGILSLGANNLSAVTITGGSASSYIRTNGAGALTVNNITTGKTLPIGNAKYNPLIIENGSGHNWTAKASDGVTPDGGFTTDKAVLVTWDITPSVNPPAAPADITFQFDEATQVGPQFTTGTSVQAWNRSTGNWIATGTPAAVNTTIPNAATVKVTGLSTFSPYALANIDGPLPVKFTNVKAYQQGSGIKVDWSNLAEAQVTNYKVERSADGQSFTALTTVNPLRNDGSRADYSFFDASPINGVNFYRIQALEFDGHKLFSVVIRVDTRKDVTQITIYPNPVTGGQVSLQATALPKGQYTIRVINAGGQQVYTKQLLHNGGAVTEAVQLPAAIKTGMYSIQLTGGEVNLSKSFIIR